MPYAAVRVLASHSVTISSESRRPMAIIDMLFIETCFVPGHSSIAAKLK